MTKPSLPAAPWVQHWLTDFPEKPDTPFENLLKKAAP